MMRESMRTGPWVWAALGTVGGVIVCDSSPAWAPWIAVAAGLVALHSMIRRNLGCRLPLAAFLALGAARGFPDAGPVPVRIGDAARGGPTVVVDGTVKRALLPSVGLTGAGRWCELERATLTDGRGVRPVRGRVRCRLPDGPESVVRGSRVRARGHLFTARRARNPGEPDGPRRWRREGVAAGLDVPTAGLLELRAPAPPHDLRARIDRGRVTVLERFRDALPPRTAGLAAALVLGVRSGLDPALREAVAGTGTAHLLAISGLHLALLVGLARALAGVLVRPNAADLGAASLAIAYAAFAGAAAPVLRATVGAVVLHLGRAAGRRSGRFEPLAIAAILLLLFDPAELFRPGFQLSFAAVAALLAGPPARRDPTPARRFLIEPLLLSARAVLATTPLVLFHFGRISPLGPLVTLVVTPLFLTTFFASIGVACLGGGVTEGLLRISATAFAAILQSSATLPGAEWTVPRPGPLVAGALGGVVALLLLPVAARRRRLALPLVALALAGQATERRPPPHPELWLLDVGHGQAALLRTPSGRSVLFDCGSRGRDDVGPRLVLPALDAIGVGRIDVAVVSHADADHLNGLAALLAAGRVATVVSGPRIGETATARGVIEAARRADVPWREIGRGDAIPGLGSGLSIRVLAPTDDSLPSENDDSVVLDVRAGSVRILLPGDVEADGIRRLLRLQPDLRSDVLVLPHHGQPEPALGPLLARTRPRLVLASRRGPLSDGVRRQIERVGAETSSTADGGAVRVRLRTDGKIRADSFAQETSSQ